MPVSRDPIDVSVDAVALARAATAAARAERRRRDAATDLFLADEVRLDERMRAAVRARLAGLVEAIERDLRVGAAWRLAERGSDAAAARIADATRPLLDGLIRFGALADENLVGELIGQAGLEQLAADLPAEMADRSDRPCLLVRLSDFPDPLVAEAAVLMLDADNRARDTVAMLPEPLHAELCWRIAAALAHGVGGGAADQAIVEAALDVLAAPPLPDSERAALALAQAIAARPDELADLLTESLGDRHPALFVALVAEAIALPTTEVRDALLDRDAARLAVMLRAAGIERGSIARIGVALTDADPRRDLERFADTLDAVMALAPADAVAALAPLTWPQPFRRAQRQLEMPA